ncbi:MAG: hypothetical protein L3J71_15935 [Victivallaceae bacterium]|nr:hypothetical protein [Victivallaceae bacterium]
MTVIVPLITVAARIWALIDQGKCINEDNCPEYSDEIIFFFSDEIIFFFSDDV